ncbi:putative DNA-dependent RNA polymerase [Alteromonas phage vB_AspP-H4/4]|uniref:DNA-directed RNA polymerase n=1 Tax=Alteromonas phage vB_AspP-H4/4 TaxID=2928692 RepID=A0A220YL36_9CAUD|nr:putative DNA-dependent RNA polymerase [Alteromonas phage vB_AspP-H4/4]ASL24386.1 putative DNA-dependent RNA polymerase [Alteromonas phage vB_AspP-H4/4]
MLSFITKAVSQALTINNIQNEVDSLIDSARNEIALFDAVDEWLAANLASLPVVLGGEVIVKFENSRGWTVWKEQSVSESLWIIAMQQIQYHGAVNTDLVSTAIANWINDHCYTEHESLGKKTYKRMHVTREECMPVTKDLLTSMKDLSIIKSTLEKRIVRLQDGGNITVKAYVMTEALEQELNQLIDVLRDRVSMKCAPLVHKPADWTDIDNGIADGANIKLITGSKLRKKTVSPKVLEAVNKLQSVRFTVADCMFAAAKDMKLNGQLYKGDTFASMFNSKELNAEAFDIYRELETLQGKEFHFPVTMDKRGRMYYRGGLLSPQGVDFCKAAFQFAEFKKLGRDGFKAICIHIANCIGYDKESIKDRIKYVQSHWDVLLDIDTHMDVRRVFPSADVFQALVAIKEVQRLNNISGEWSEKTSNLVCHQDGTCNGLQHSAAITGHRQTAKTVNCVASTQDDKPADIYGIIAQVAARLAEDDSVRMLILKYGRSMAKNPVMITGYGARESTIIGNTAKFLAQKGEDVSKASDVAKCYITAIEEEAGAVTQLTDAIKARMEYAIAEGKRTFNWMTADGFLASTTYEDTEAVTVRVGKSIAVRKRGVGRLDLDIIKTAQAMSPNFTHSIDATHLRLVVNACEHDLVAVHDSIGSSPADFFTTGNMIRQKFAMVHNCYDALGDLCESMEQARPVFDEKNDYNANEALESAYIFS